MWWTILGVSPTADSQEIKRAYSKLIKQYRPEDHPEEFSRIREAFEAGRRAVKQRRQGEAPRAGRHMEPVEPLMSAPEESQPPARYDIPFEPNYSQTFHRPEPEPEPEHSQPPEPERQPAGIEPPAPLNASALRAEVRANLDEWQSSRYKDATALNAVLQHPDLNHFDGMDIIGETVFEWLIEHIAPKSGFLATTTNIPVRVIQDMDRIFGWSKRERELYAIYQRDLSLIFYAINSQRKETRYVDPTLKANAQTQENGNKNNEEPRSTLWRLLGWAGTLYAAFVFLGVFNEAESGIAKTCIVILALIFFDWRLFGFGIYRSITRSAPLRLRWFAFWSKWSLFLLIMATFALAGC